MTEAADRYSEAEDRRSEAADRYSEAADRCGQGAPFLWRSLRKRQFLTKMIVKASSSAEEAFFRDVCYNNQICMFTVVGRLSARAILSREDRNAENYSTNNISSETDRLDKQTFILYSILKLLVILTLIRRFSCVIMRAWNLHSFTSAVSGSQLHGGAF